MLSLAYCGVIAIVWRVAGLWGEPRAEDTPWWRQRLPMENWWILAGSALTAGLGWLAGASLVRVAGGRAQRRRTESRRPLAA